jgi:hypothetical protein
LPAGFEVVSGALTGYTSLTPGATEATLVVVRAPDGALPAATVAEATFDDGDHVWVRGVTLGGPLAVFLPRLLRP